jgi:DUF2917 family protein
VTARESSTAGSRPAEGSNSSPKFIATLLEAAAGLLRRTRGEARVEVRLADGRAWSGRVGRSGVTVRCAEGALWITRERDPEDHLLSAGGEFRSTATGVLAVVGLGAARAIVVGEVKARPKLTDLMASPS